MISKSLEDAYRDFLMQHKFPFAVIHFHINGEEIDVNVHPTKMELRFQKQQEVYNTVYEGVHRTLLEPELIPKAEVPDPVSSRRTEGSPFLLKPKTAGKPSSQQAEAEPSAAGSEQKTDIPAAGYVQDTATAPAGCVQEERTPYGSPGPEMKKPAEPEVKDEDYFIRKMRERVLAYHNRSSSAEVSKKDGIFRPEVQSQRIQESARQAAQDGQTVPDAGKKETCGAISDPSAPAAASSAASAAAEQPISEEKPKQLDLFEENFLKREIKAEYKLIGQVFDTYWLVEFHDSLYIIDQHAAHERVLYERTLRSMKTREFTSQYLSPPIILTLSMAGVTAPE